MFWAPYRGHSASSSILPGQLRDLRAHLRVLRVDLFLDESTGGAECPAATAPCPPPPRIAGGRALGLRPMDEAPASHPLVSIRGVSRHYTRGVDEVHALERRVARRSTRGRFVALHGAVGLRQVDAAEPRLRHRPADERRGRASPASRLNDLDEDELARLARAPRRPDLPVLQPDAGAVGARERRAAAAAHRRSTSASAGARAETALRVVGLARAPRPLPAHALGRRAAARRDRARDRHRSRPDRRRRADRRPRREERRGRSSTLLRELKDALRQDHRHGHARSARAALRRPGRSTSTRACCSRATSARTRAARGDPASRPAAGAAAGARHEVPAARARQPRAATSCAPRSPAARSRSPCCSSACC